MRKIISLSLLAFVLLFASCNSEQDSIDYNPIENTQNLSQSLNFKDYEFVGEEHNRILGLIHEELTADDIKNKRAVSITGNIIKKEIETYIIEDKSRKIIHTLIDEELILIRNDDDSVYKGLESFLNDETMSYLDQVDNVLMDEYNDVTERLNDLEKIIIEIENSKLDNNSKVMLFSSIAVAKHSTIYWTENFDALQAKFNNESTFNSKFTTKGLLDYAKGCWKADFAGAVGGAVRTAVVNGIPGAGQAAYAGGVIGMAVGASAVYHVNKWW